MMNMLSVQKRQINICRDRKKIDGISRKGDVEFLDTN